MTTWTAEQRLAIERRDGDLLLDAGAGSGKTSVLVERFVSAVLQDGVDVGAMLVITFTEKAAGELRDRIRGRLRELGAAEEARATEGAFISTIHGFCARVLRAGALAAGLDPGFVVLDRDQSAPVAAAAFEQTLREFAQAGDAAVTLLADYGAGPLQATIRSVYGQLRSRGQPAPRLPPAPPDPGEATARALAAAARALIAELAAIADPGRKVLEALGRLERCQALLCEADLWPAALDAVTLPGTGAALRTDACVAYSGALSAHRAACAARCAIPVRELMDRLLSGFGAHYEQGKRALSGVDFEDLELLASDLLARRADLRRQYAERFERIMVDELQDTNAVQLALIESIARDNLFTVGDAQQSIYRFRHADVSLFSALGARLQERGARAGLQTNFRSHPEVLAVINAGFAQALGDEFRPLLPGRAAVDPRDIEVVADAWTGPRAELLLTDKGADWQLEGMAAPWRLAEARALGRRVRELVAAGTRPGQVVVLLRATTDMRAYERALEAEGLPTYVIGGRGYWSHPQVLDLIAYLAVLANPLDDESLLTVLASPLVGVSLDALVVLAGAARTREQPPWSVLADSGEALAELPAEEREALAEFAAWCRAERAAAPRLGVAELIGRALARSGYDEAMLAMPGGRRRLANVRKLMRLGGEHERDHGLDLRGFLDLAAARAAGLAGSSREGEAPLEGEGLDAIRLMTIHRAKGLEFHTVCVADLGRSTRPPHELIRVGADGRLGLRLARTGEAGRVSALAYDQLGAEQRAAEEREERRLFYVAMTRAQERLILSGATRFAGWQGDGRNGGGTVAWVAPAFVPELGARIAGGGGRVELSGAELELRVLTGPQDEPGPLAERPDRASGDDACEAIVYGAVIAPPPAAPPAPPVSTLSYSALGEYASCGYRFYAERVLGLAPVPAGPAGTTGSGGAVIPGGTAVSGGAGDEIAGVEPEQPRPVRPAAQRGVLIHALLERLNFRRPVPPDAEAVGTVARRLGIVPPTPVEARELIGLITTFAASELCQRLGRAGEARREERFAFALSAGVLVTGAIDVLAREPGGTAVVVDYKSDRLGADEPEAVVRRSYATQQLVYALAALHSGADAVEVIHCFLERTEQPVSVRFPAAERSQLDERLEVLAGGLLRSEFGVSPLPHRRLCAGCPAEAGLCSWPLEMTRREAPDRLF